MGWTEQVDGYCERLGPEFWAEPVNAVTNLAFVAVAVLMWSRSRDVAGARVLSAILFMIGVGSGLFHTFATRWAGMADVLPIALFILTYLYLVNFRMLRLSWWLAVPATALFFPFAGLVTVAVSRVPFLEVSGPYWSVPALLVIYAVALGSSLGRATVRGFLAGAGILTLSLVFRSLDQSLCEGWPLGTHFAWHLLNAVMLGTMIGVYRRHVLAAKGRQG